MKIYVVGGNTQYTRFISDAELVDNVQDADVVLFTGGEDVSPEIYGKRVAAAIYNNLARDLEEKTVFESIPEGKLVVGICRGLI